MEEVVSYFDVNTMVTKQAEGAESCGNDDKLPKYDHNTFDLFSSNHTSHSPRAPWENSDQVQV